MMSAPSSANRTACDLPWPRAGTGDECDLVVYPSHSCPPSLSHFVSSSPSALHIRNMPEGFDSSAHVPALLTGATVASMSTPAEDLEEIRKLLARYCFAIDIKDAVGFSELFTDDGVFDFTLGPPVQGRDALQQFVKGIPDDRHHVTTNEIIELDGDRATVRAYAVVTKESPPVHQFPGGVRGHAQSHPRGLAVRGPHLHPSLSRYRRAWAGSFSGSVMLGVMGSPSITVDLILEAARKAIAERGPGKLTSARRRERRRNLPTHSLPVVSH